jgi:PTH1 family peptidyl-tRNA hydrolase
MALFQKKPQVSNSAPLYTVGLNKSLLIVGLGNIGKEYELTRHNIGFLCADHLVNTLDLPDFIQKKNHSCYESSGKTGDKRIIVIKPTTYMNLSGQAVRETMNFYKITTEDVLVLHDDLDITFGEIRTKTGGGSAGHNGIKSLIKEIGQDFKRIRVGIKNPELEKLDSADFVLQKFLKEEQEKLNYMQKEVTALVTESIYDGKIENETRKFI